MLAIANAYFEKERDGVDRHYAMFRESFRLVTMAGMFPEIPDSNKLIVTDKNLRNVEWTKRFLRLFIDSGEPWMVKLDPDVEIQDGTEMKPSEECDVAGDFRTMFQGLLFVGSFHYITRQAAISLVNDSHYSGTCLYEDVPLAASVMRNHLKALNWEKVNAWAIDGDPITPIYHKGRSKLNRLPLGIIKF
jgi:hypothetical protein